MANKINELNGSALSGATPTNVSRPSGSAPASSTGTPAAPAAQEGAGGEVHITDTATWLATLETGLREAPAVDTARVAVLRAAIEQNGYTVQPEHVATQLLQMEQALAHLQGKAIVVAPGGVDEKA